MLFLGKELGSVPLMFGSVKSVMVHQEIHTELYFCFLSLLELGVGRVKGKFHFEFFRLSKIGTNKSLFLKQEYGKANFQKVRDIYRNQSELSTLTKMYNKYISLVKNTWRNELEFPLI